jgi:uncharacterized membrane protein
MRAWLIPLSVVLTAAVWRFSEAPTFAFACSAITVLTAAHVGWRWTEHSLRSLILTCVAGILIIASHLIPWSCDIDCQGGYRYQSLVGVPTPIFGVVLLIILAVSARFDQRRARESLATHALACALAGTSLYFLWLSWQLRMVCPYCLSAHTAVLSVAALSLRNLRREGSWKLAAHSLVIAALAAVLLHVAYEEDPNRVIDEPPPSPGTAAKPDDPIVAQIEQGRRIGRANAPLILEVVTDLQCSKCAQIAPELMKAIEQDINDGRVEVIHRIRWHRSQPMSRTLAEWSLAAAFAGRAQFKLYMAAALGSKPGAQEDAVREQVGALVDVNLLERIKADHATAIDQILLVDESRIAELDVVTPATVLRNRATGAVIEIREGHLLEKSIPLLSELIRSNAGTDTTWGSGGPLDPRNKSK